MAFRNSSQHYGFITKLLHASIALLIISQYFLVYCKNYLLLKESELAKFFITGLHKPLGVVTLGLVIFAAIWHLLNRQPEFPIAMATWQRFTAKITHLLLYLSMLVMSSSGIIMTTAFANPANIFGLYKLPLFINQNKELGKIAFNIHETTSFALLALIILHTLAALEHHFIEKDNVCRRMFFSK